MNSRSTFMATAIGAMLVGGARAEPSVSPASAVDAAPQEVEFSSGVGDSRAGPAGPYEPDRAMRQAVNGVAVIACKVKPDRDLYACKVVSETPRDYGFGVAATNLAEEHAIRAPALANNAAWTAGMIVQFRVPFILPWVASTAPDRSN